MEKSDRKDSSDRNSKTFSTRYIATNGYMTEATKHAFNIKVWGPIKSCVLLFQGWRCEIYCDVSNQGIQIDTNPKPSIFRTMHMQGWKDFFSSV